MKFRVGEKVIIKKDIWKYESSNTPNGIYVTKSMCVFAGQQGTITNIKMSDGIQLFYVDIGIYGYVWDEILFQKCGVSFK